MSGVDPTVPAVRGASADDDTLDASHPGGLPSPARVLPARPPARYQRLGEIARGGMGRIVAAQDLELGRVVAIKELHTITASLEKRFEREIRLTARLQHPGIIAVQEAGRWPDGAPFYTMPHVVGQPLDRVIERATTLPARLALVPRVQAIAEAIAYAHGEQVIHRDLKPNNVLIGTYGETIVIDWGLAKDLRDGADDSLAGTSSDDGMVTVLGEAIGTPSYMPPEQARGERSDPRADVYAVGAILYHVLAGVRPYAETKVASDVVAQVLARPPTSLDELVPEAPADLRAIVSKAMARDAADRYATAAGLAEDLRRFTGGQLVAAHRYSAAQRLGRWVRRHRGAVAVGTAAALALAVVGTLAVLGIRDERDAARAQRARAEASRGQVEELMEFMLTDLHGKLKPLGKLELLSMVANRAVAYYDAQPFDAGDVGASRRRGIAHVQSGDVMASAGDLASAVAAYRRAIDILGAAGRDHELAQAQDLLGRALALQGARDAALAASREALALRERLAAAGRTGLEREIASSHQMIGNLLVAAGDVDAALAEHRAGLEVARRAYAAAPDAPESIEAVAVLEVAIGDTLEVKGDLPGSLEAYRRGRELTERLARATPGDATNQQRLAAVTDRVGTILRLLGDFAGALDAHRASLAISERLAAGDPTNVRWSDDVATGHVSVGDVLKAQGDAEGALDSYRRAHELRIRNAAMDPTNADLARDLANSHDRLADILIDLGKLDDGEAGAQAAFEIRKRLAAEHPDSHQALRDVYISHYRLGVLRYERGNVTLAVGAFEQGLALAREAAAKFPDVASLADDVGVIENALEQVRGATAAPAGR